MNAHIGFYSRLFVANALLWIRLSGSELFELRQLLLSVLGVRSGRSQRQELTKLLGRADVILLLDQDRAQELVRLRHAIAAIELLHFADALLGGVVILQIVVRHRVVIMRLGEIDRIELDKS